MNCNYCMPKTAWSGVMLWTVKVLVVLDCHSGGGGDGLSR